MLRSYRELERDWFADLEEACLETSASEPPLTDLGPPPRLERPLPAGTRPCTRCGSPARGWWVDRITQERWPCCPRCLAWAREHPDRRELVFRREWSHPPWPCTRCKEPTIGRWVDLDTRESWPCCPECMSWARQNPELQHTVLRQGKGFAPTEAL